MDQRELVKYMYEAVRIHSQHIKGAPAALIDDISRPRNKDRVSRTYGEMTREAGEKLIGYLTTQGMYIVRVHTRACVSCALYDDC